MIRKSLLTALCVIPVLLAVFFAVLHGSEHRSVFSSVIIMCGGCLVYGITRLVAFHPAFRSGYLDWLKSTNWSVRERLPFGEFTHFKTIDLLLFFPMCMSWYLGAGLAVPLNAALIGFVLPMMLRPTQATKHRPRRCRTNDGIAVFAAGFCILASVNQWLLLVCLLAFSRFVSVNDRAGLAGIRNLLPYTKVDVFGRELGKSNTRVGFPFDRLTPWASLGIGLTGETPVKAAAIRALLAGWVIFCSCFRIELLFNGLAGVQSQDAFLGFLFVCVVVAVIRLMTFVCLHRSPVGLWTRVRTGRLICPGFDVVFVVPLLILVSTAFFMMPPVINLLGVPLVIGIALPWSWFLAATGKPTYEKFHLTGNHRLDPGPFEKMAIAQKSA